MFFAPKILDPEESAVMPRLFVPPRWRDRAGGRVELDLEAQTVRQLLFRLQEQFPELAHELWDGETLRPGLNLAVGGALLSKNLFVPLQPDSEVHILPALGAG